MFRDALDQLQRRAAARPATISFAGGLPQEKLFPRRALSGAFLRALHCDSSALQYGWPEGREGLRAWIAKRLTRRGFSVSQNEVLITSGAQQAISIAAQLTLPKGQPILVDKETYPAALELFHNLHIPCITSGKARCAYRMPAIGNPHGNGVSEEKRRAMLAAKGFLIEDDAYAELRFDGAASPPLAQSARSRVFHVGTFSKTLCPGLRVGWLVPPRKFYERALKIKSGLDLQANSLGQSVLEFFLGEDDFDARLDRSRHFYLGQAERLALALQRHLPSWRFRFPDGGFSFWIDTDEEKSDLDVLRAATHAGVSFDPGCLFRAKSQTSLALRLCYSAISPSAIDEGVKRLAKAWRACSKRRKLP